MSQPRSAVSAARGMDKHRLFGPSGSSCGIVIWRQSWGSFSGVEPSGLQHSSGLPFSFAIRWYKY